MWETCYKNVAYNFYHTICTIHFFNSNLHEIYYMVSLLNISSKKQILKKKIAKHQKYFDTPQFKVEKATTQWVTLTTTQGITLIKKDVTLTTNGAYFKVIVVNCFCTQLKHQGIIFSNKKPRYCRLSVGIPSCPVKACPVQKKTISND